MSGVPSRRCGAGARTRCAAALRTAGIAAVLPLLAGCIVVSARLAPDGSGTMTMRYRVAHDATEFVERRRFTSPHVRVESVKIAESLDTVVTLAFDDVAQLPTAPAFRDVRVVREREGDGERLTVVVPRATAIPPQGRRPAARVRPGPRSRGTCRAASGQRIAVRSCRAIG